MVKQASLFSQLLCLVDRHHFEREVRRLSAERHAKGFSCWSQFVAMMFCQLAQAKSLREIIDGLACCEAWHTGSRLAKNRRGYETWTVSCFCSWFERDLHHLGKRFALTGVLARDTRQGFS